MEEKKGKGKNIVIVILIILLLGVGGYLAYYYFYEVPNKISKLESANDKLHNKISELEKTEKNNDKYIVEAIGKCNTKNINDSCTKTAEVVLNGKNHKIELKQIFKEVKDEDFGNVIKVFEEIYYDGEKVDTILLYHFPTSESKYYNDDYIENKVYIVDGKYYAIKTLNQGYEVGGPGYSLSVYKDNKKIGKTIEYAIPSLGFKSNSNKEVSEKYFEFDGHSFKVWSPTSKSVNKYEITVDNDKVKGKIIDTVKDAELAGASVESITIESFLEME